MTIMSRYACSVLWLSLMIAAGGERLAAQDTHVHGFTDVRFSAGNRDSSGFKLGQLAIFVTSELAPGFSFLAETAFEYDTDFVVDVERLSVAYTVAPWLRLTAGKHHNPIGYWNTAYHHGTLLQPTIDRPMMFLFEDDGGVLPIHSIGLMASGRDISQAHLGYDLLLSNGLGATPKGDNNQAKAFTARVSTQATSAFLLGASGYVDHVAPGVVSPGGGTTIAPIDIAMYGGYAVFNGSPLEVRAEYQMMAARNGATGTHRANLAYGYAGLRFGELTPYVRYDVLDIASGNPWLDVPSKHGLLGGLRYDAAATVAVKGEYGFLREAGRTRNGLSMQIAVGF
jgi:hypothetical protein